MKARIVAFSVFAVLFSGGALRAEPKRPVDPNKTKVGQATTDSVRDYLRGIPDGEQRRAEALRINRALLEDYKRFAPALDKAQAKELEDTLIELSDPSKDPTKVGEPLVRFLEENDRLIGAMPPSVIAKMRTHPEKALANAALGAPGVKDLIKARKDFYERPADKKEYLRQASIPLNTIGTGRWVDNAPSPIGLSSKLNNRLPNGEVKTDFTKPKGPNDPRVLGENFNEVVGANRDVDTTKQIQGAYQKVAEILDAKTPEDLRKAMGLDGDVTALTPTERNLIEMMRLQHMSGNSGNEELLKFVSLLKKAGEAPPEERIRSLLGFNRVQQVFHTEYTKNLLGNETFRKAAGKDNLAKIADVNAKLEAKNDELTAEERKSPRDAAKIAKLVKEMNDLTLERTTLVLDALAKIEGTTARADVINQASAAAENKLDRPEGSPKKENDPDTLVEELAKRLEANAKISIRPDDVEGLKKAKKDAEENARFAIFCCGGNGSSAKRKAVCHTKAGQGATPKGPNVHGPQNVAPQRGASPPRP